MKGRKTPSVHGTGRALDVMIPDKDHKAEAIAFFTRPDVVKALGVQAVHVYRCRESKWGKAWRIGRGWKLWTATDNGGSAGAAHLHIEIDHSLADDAKGMATAWRGLKRR